MRVTVSDPAPCTARPPGSHSPAILNLHRLVRRLPAMRALTRTVALVLSLCAMAVLLTGTVRARATPDGSPAALQPDHDAGAAPISITCPKDDTVSTGYTTCSASVDFAAEATPSSGCKLVGIGYAIGSTPITSPYVFSLGTTTVTAGAVDSCGRQATCSFRITVVDQRPPTVICPANIIMNAATGGCSAGTDFAGIASDNCRVASLKFYIDATQISVPYIFYVGTTTVRMEARDPSGNSSSCSFTVSVRDTQAPHITCPANITTSADSGKCTGSVSFAASATDNCPVWPVRYYLGATEISSPYAFAVGDSTVTAKARDATGNEATCTFKVTVRDTQPPHIVCPADITTGTDPGQCSANVPFSATATDNCTPYLKYYIGPAQISSPHVFPLGTTTVTAVASDFPDNTATCTFRVTVRDTEPPEIMCPPPVSAGTDPGKCTASVSWQGALATDNCPEGAGSIHFYIGATEIFRPHDFPVGTTLLTAEIRDAAGNKGSCDFPVTVRDERPPAITCPSRIFDDVLPGQCSATRSFAATATDDCDTPTLSYYIGTTEISSPYAFPVGDTTVTAKAVDAADNEATCTFQATIRDHWEPDLTCPGNLSVGTDAGQCTATVPLTATATDNCAVEWTRFYVDGAQIPNPHTFPIGNTPVTVKAADPAGNLDLCEFTVLVRDTEAPEIICPGPVFANADPGRCTASVSWPGALATDNCPEGAWSFHFYIGTTEISRPHDFSVGTTLVTAEIRDAAGNKGSCDFPVIVRDSQPPAVSCPSDLVLSTDTGRCTATMPVTVTATDNCGVAWLKYYSGTTELRSPVTFTLGTTTVRAEASDAVSNTAECSLHVTVRDNQAPAIVCPPGVRVPPDQGQSFASNVTVGTATATDSCSPPGVVGTRGDGQALIAPYPLGRTVITWTAGDQAGNSSSCSQEVWVTSGPTKLYLPCLLRQFSPASP